ncbi:MAG: hypothetical protein SGARI_001485 [Bacillariaceae sp.]
MALSLPTLELSWCAPTDSPVRRRRQVRLRRRDAKRTAADATANAEQEHSQNASFLQPIDKFGIVAAMAKDSRVIGVDGTLAWKQSLDRQIFKSLTSNQILIVGRRTLQDERNFSLGHVRHAKYCIVLSTTLSSVDELLGGDSDGTTQQRDRDWEMLRLAGSLDEALHIANQLNVDDGKDKDDENDTATSPDAFQSPFASNLRCWVAGGERLFEEALKHPSAKELHLSTVNVDIDIQNLPIDSVTKFPAKYRWDHNYKSVFLEEYGSDESPSVQPEEPTFSYQVFQRIERNKPNQNE